MPVLRAANRKLVLPGVSRTWSGGFSFVQAADCQLGMEWTMNWKLGEQDKFYPLYDGECVWDYEIAWSKAFINHLKSLNPRPKFGIICGDMLDAFPERFPLARKRQKRDFDRVMNNSEVPIICVCGNHDVGNAPTAATLDNYRQEFGDDAFTFECEGVLCIVINSQFYENSEHVHDEAWEHDLWLEQQLKDAQDKYKTILLFQHIPWFINSPSEPDQYFNIRPDLRKEMLEKLDRAGVNKVFCGHYHRNAGGWYNNMEVVVTSAIGAQLGANENGFRIVDVTADNVSHRYVKIINTDET